MWQKNSPDLNRTLGSRNLHVMSSRNMERRFEAARGLAGAPLASAPVSRATFLRMALCGVAAACLPPRLAQAATPDDFSGSYRYAGGSHEKDLLEQAIEEATSEMNFLIRGIARDRISSAVEPRGSLKFDFGTNYVTFRSPGMPVLRAPVDGTPIRWTNSEDAVVEVRCQLEGDTLRIRYRGDGGDTQCVYRFDAERSRLELSARVDHEQLPGTLRYRLTYSRE